jgi:hypothetical protein
MIRSVSRLVALVVGALALAALVPAAAASASASTVGPTRVGPHQVFAGEINGQTINAQLKVVCGVASTHGRALGGQTIAVTSPPVTASNYGETGSRAKEIATSLSPTSAGVTIVFTTYNDPQPFPTNINVPCSGTSVISFIPVPGSKTARPAKVTVSYDNVGTTTP